MWEISTAVAGAGALGFAVVAIVLAFMLIREIRSGAKTNQLLIATEGARADAAAALEPLQARIEAMEMAVKDLSIQLDEKDALIAQLGAKSPGTGRKMFDEPAREPAPLPPTPRSGGAK